MRNKLKEILEKALKDIGAEPEAEALLEVPRDESFGDFSSPVAMGLAKILKKSPRDIAALIVSSITSMEEDAALFEGIEVAGPGFINFTFKRDFLYEELRQVISGEIRHEDVGKGMRVQVEFVSANPTGPLHLGHGRGAAVGSALCSLLAATGYDVTREYYVNDAGRQVRLLAESVFARYKELLGVTYTFPEEGYRGDYVLEIAEEIKQKEGDRFKDADFTEAEEFFSGHSLEAMLAEIKLDLGSFGVSFDTWQSEKELYSEGAVEHAVDFLKQRGHIYEQEGAVWFRATGFGDDKDRVVIKSDGAPTYFASDIAYHLKKVEAGYGEIINIWGADHHGYIPRIEAVMDALGYDRERLKVLLVQMVSLERAGKPVQMSKRAGTFVTLKEVTDEVGADTTRFIFLTRRHDSHLSFDLESAKAQSSENPVYYVQYANARINSIFRHAKEQCLKTEGLQEANLSPLSEAEELRIIRKLLGYTGAVESAALGREPHRITYYLQELAGMFHPYYNTHRIVGDDTALTMARLGLCRAIAEVLKDGLGLIGISAPEKM